jgi:hypothetical protein
MTNSDRVAAGPRDVAVEEALTDHHLEELSAMIEQAQAAERTFEPPSDDGPAVSLGGS